MDSDLLKGFQCFVEIISQRVQDVLKKKMYLSVLDEGGGGVCMCVGGGDLVLCVNNKSSSLICLHTHTNVVIDWNARFFFSLCWLGVQMHGIRSGGG